MNIDKQQAFQRSMRRQVWLKQKAPMGECKKMTLKRSLKLNFFSIRHNILRISFVIGKDVSLTIL